MSYKTSNAEVEYGIWHLHVRLSVLRDTEVYKLMDIVKQGLNKSEEERLERLTHHSCHS